MRAAVFNTISVIFFLLTLASATFTVVRLAGPPPVPEVVDLPTLAPDLPTLTPSNTPTPTIPPTFTLTPTDTPTLTPTLTLTSTLTLTPTITPSPTITDTPGPTETPTETPEPTATPTSSEPTPTPPPSPDPFPFRLREDVFFGPNVYNTLGCAWQGIGGRVFDQNGIDLFGNFQVRVFNNTFDRTVLIGSNSLYGGASGWEVQVSSVVNSELYFVRLETVPFGVPVTPNIQVQFSSDCGRNLALLNFVQQRRG